MSRRGMNFVMTVLAALALALTGDTAVAERLKAELDRAFRQAQARVTADPGLIAPGWTLYALTAEEAEFWQGDPQRRHVRLRYRRAGGGWTRQLLWP